MERVYFFLDCGKDRDKVPIKFTLVLDIKMTKLIDGYLVSLTNPNKSIIVGIRMGSKVSVDYKSTSGRLETIPFELHPEPKSGVEIALSVGEDNITLSINCWQKSVRKKPDDFPKDAETNGVISIWRRELAAVRI